MEKILLVISLLFLLGSVKCLKQSWVSPAGINIIWNSLFIFCAVVLFGSEIDWQYAGIAWMVISCFLFLLGQVLGKRIMYSNKSRERNICENVSITNVSYMALIVLTIFCLGRSLLYITAYGFHLAELLDIQKLLKINTVIANARYGENLISLGVMGKMMLVLSYFIALMGGYLFPYAKKSWERVSCVFVVCPVLANILITNVKSELIATVFLWISGYLTANLSRGEEKEILSPKVLRRLIGVGAACIILFDFVMMLRIGSINIETQRIVTRKLQTYAFGHIHAFSYWFGNVEELPYDLGSNTYMFFTNWLGVTVRKIGVYDPIEGISSNVFTQNRGIIADFGKIGGLIYWGVLGIISGTAYKVVNRGSCNKQILAKGLLAAVYFSILYGFIISPWIYSSYVLALVIFIMALFVIRYFKISIRSK